MQQPKSIGEAIEKIRMFHHIQFACAPTQMDEQEDLRWVHAVGEEPIPEVVSGSALDKLSQVVGQLQGAVELLSCPCGTPDAVRRVERPVPLFRPDVHEGCYVCGRGSLSRRHLEPRRSTWASEPTCLRKGIRLKCLPWERRELAKQRVS
ncbi:hypothetical protein DPMN_027056 [Dreissena polymorpha]|uniref:Uncharacterized protein n=1 Tax=Dreissena polymorpha TaxID=45954 RepID=A0A9D4RDA4_DREPO|nr:hypothetical protein DPMN_027056 [Dreissena polymorpha]